MTCEIAAEDLVTTRTKYSHWETESKVLSKFEGKHYPDGCHWRENGSVLFFNDQCNGVCVTSSDCRALCTLPGNLVDCVTRQFQMAEEIDYMSVPIDF